MDDAHTELTMFANARDRQPWTDEDLADLRESVELGQSISATVAFLSREGTVGDVIKTAAENGWEFDELKSIGRASSNHEAPVVGRGG
jgi:hypothetical protein